MATLCKGWLALGAAALVALLAGCSLPSSLFVEDTPTASPTVDLPATSLVEPMPAPAATPTGEAAAPALALPVRYTVQPGDTLLGIAVQHHVSMAAIQLVNGLGDSDLIRAGQALTIPLPLHEAESPFWVVHVVRPGETLFKIARTYSLALDDLLRVNAVADPALIAVGQPLVIPLETLAVAQAPTSTPAPPPTPTPTSSPTPAVIPIVSPPPWTAPPPGLETATPAPLAEPTPAPQPQPQPTVPAEVSAWAGQVVELINRKRVEAGLPALTIAPELVRAAQAHAEDCSRRGWGSHVGSDGASTLVRFQRAGYEARAWGENWVQAFDPVGAVNWWYDEIPPNDPHRKNILSPRYAEIGVGIAPAGNGYYFIADFGNR